MKNLRTNLNSVLQSAGFIALSFSLSACTNGMMGQEESGGASSNGQTNGAGFVDQGASTSTPTQILITPESVVGKFKAYGAKLRGCEPANIPVAPCPAASSAPVMTSDPFKVGVVVDVEKPLVGMLGQAMVNDLVSRVANETAIGDIPVTVNLTSYVLGLDANQGRKVTFKFRKMVKYGKLNNTLVLFPNRQVGLSATASPVLTRVTPLPISARIIQFLGKEIYLVGGLGNDGYSSDRVFRISPTGTVQPPADTDSTWGGPGTLYSGTERPMLISPFHARGVLDNYLSEPNDICINSGSQTCDPGGVGANGGLSAEERAAAISGNAIITVTFNGDFDPFTISNGDFNQFLQEVRILFITGSTVSARTFCASQDTDFAHSCNQNRKNFIWDNSWSYGEMLWRHGNPYETHNQGGMTRSASATVVPLNTAVNNPLEIPLIGPQMGGFLGGFTNLTYTGTNPAIKVEPL